MLLIVTNSMFISCQIFHIVGQDTAHTDELKKEESSNEDLVKYHQ